MGSISGSCHPKHSHEEWSPSSGLLAAVCALCHLGWAGGSDALQAAIYGACMLNSLLGLTELCAGVIKEPLCVLSARGQGAILVYEERLSPSQLE